MGLGKLRGAQSALRWVQRSLETKLVFCFSNQSLYYNPVLGLRINQKTKKQ